MEKFGEVIATIPFWGIGLFFIFCAITGKGGYPGRIFKRAQKRSIWFTIGGILPNLVMVKFLIDIMNLKYEMNYVIGFACVALAGISYFIFAGFRPYILPEDECEVDGVCPKDGEK